MASQDRFNNMRYGTLVLLALASQSLAKPFVSDPTTTFTTEPKTTATVVTDPFISSHETFTGTPTTTGALSTKVLAASIKAGPPVPGSTDYPADGKLHKDMPAPYTPNGGNGTNGSEPVYRPMSDFDYQSLSLALYQEYFELDLFRFALAEYPMKEFERLGLTPDDRYLLEFMAEQEVGHATLLTNILGREAPKPCSYHYPVKNLTEYIDFSQKATRWGESGVYGFINHLDSRAAGQLLTQSISTEARQQMIFRQFAGLFPMPVWFEVGVPQSWAWTLLAPYISWCPADQTRLVWQHFPALQILPQPNPARINGSNAFNETTGAPANSLSTANITQAQSCINATEGENCAAAISRNRTNPLSYPGRQVFLRWDDKGQHIGPNNSYVTNTTAGDPKFALWVNQLNATYTPLEAIGNHSAHTFQPNMTTFEGDPAINGTIFLAITDDDLHVTPFNLSMVNPHVKALGLYQAG